jgi:hypothetical protein
MNCLYCQQALEETPAIKDTVFKAECQECHALFRFFQGQAPYVITWEDIFIGEKEYRIRILPTSHLSPTKSRFTVSYWVEHQLTASVTHHYWCKIIELDFVPTWTPQTAAHKLKTYLPFL